MCITRNWKSLESSTNSSTIIARRSDGTNFMFFDAEGLNIFEFVRKLEEFRNCQCSPDSPCIKHLEEKERINANGS